MSKLLTGTIYAMKYTYMFFILSLSFSPSLFLGQKCYYMCDELSVRYGSPVLCVLPGLHVEHVSTVRNVEEVIGSRRLLREDGMVEKEKKR